MPTRNVVLTERQETLIEALVQSGRYQNASEVMREGLRLVENREVEEATKLAALRAAAQLGVSALARLTAASSKNLLTPRLWSLTSTELAMRLSLERGTLDEDALESSRRCRGGKGLRSNPEVHGRLSASGKRASTRPSSLTP